MGQGQGPLLWYIDCDDVSEESGQSVPDRSKSDVSRPVRGENWRREDFHPALALSSDPLRLKVQFERQYQNLRRGREFSGEPTSWQYHFGLLHTVTSDRFCGRFIHTTHTSVRDIQLAAEK